MFSGIVTGQARVREVRPLKSGADMRLVLGTAWAELPGLAIGASVSCSGCCLTVVEKGADWFAVDVSAETLSQTTLGSWTAGSRVNLERSLRLGEELGGHLVFGHVDGIGRAIAATADHGSMRWRLRAPAELVPLIARKGSIAADGVSLTVNEVEDTEFTINLIPYTATQTTLGGLNVGTEVNLEVDPLARYVARLAEFPK